MGLLLSATAIFAFTDPEIKAEVLIAFQKDFSFAKNVKWEVDSPLFKVNFSVNDQGFVAWYNDAAELVSTARNLLFTQLPLAVMKSMESKYEDASILSIVEVTKESETSYLIQVEDAKAKRLLRAYPSGRIDRIKKLKS